MNEIKWDLDKLSTGDRSVLKRCAGEMLRDQVKAIEVFYRGLIVFPKKSESQWFACMCMDCLWNSTSQSVKPFEEMLRDLYNNKNTSPSMRKRIVALLDIPWSEDGYLLGKLAGFAHMFRSANNAAKPDFNKLADDLSSWNHPDRFVQRKWIRVICRESDENN